MLDLLRFYRLLPLLLLQFVVLVKGQSGTWSEECTPEPNPRFLISTQEDADQLSRCYRLSGDVDIETNAASLVMRGIGEIRGDLHIHNSPFLSTFHAPDFTLLEGRLELTDLGLLERWRAGNLRNVSHMELVNLPLLRNWSWSFGDYMLAPSMGSLIVSDTALTYVTSLSVTQIDDLIVTDNPDMYAVDLPTLSRTTNATTITGNGELPDPDVIVVRRGTYIRLQELVQAASITISRVSYVAMNKLQTVDRYGLTIRDTGIASLQFPNLTSIQGTLTVTGNPFLWFFDLGAVRTILPFSENPPSENPKALGALEISGIRQRGSLRFGNLTEVGSTIKIEGGFSSITFPRIDRFYHDVFINSTVSTFSCQQINEIYRNTPSQPPFTGTQVCLSSGSNSTVSVSDPPVHKSKDSGGLSPKESIPTIFSCVFIAIVFCAWFIGHIKKRHGAPSSAQQQEDFAWAPASPRRSVLQDSPLPSRPPTPPPPVRPSREPAVESGHELPVYRAKGLPGEVPPTYKENERMHENSFGAGDRSSVGEPTTQERPSSTGARYRGRDVAEQ